MKFEINGSEWKIEEIEDYEMRTKAQDDCTMALTVYMEATIYLARHQSNIIKTLKHELTHVWLYEYGHGQSEKKPYYHEEICEIVACSNAFINEIVKRYKEEKK